jgi:hypothetical protein
LADARLASAHPDGISSCEEALARAAAAGLRFLESSTERRAGLQHALASELPDAAERAERAKRLWDSPGRELAPPASANNLLE